MNTIKIVRDEDAESPRTNRNSNQGIMVYYDKKYILGDIPTDDLRNYKLDLIEKEVGTLNTWIEKLPPINYDNREAYIDRQIEIESKVDEYFDRYFISKPLYLMDHSSLTIRTSPFGDRFDSGLVGFIYANKECIKQDMGWKRLTQDRQEFIESILADEVDTYNNYINGFVYGFEVIDESNEIIDSVYGFYGNDHKTSGMLYYFPANWYDPLKYQLVDEQGDKVNIAMHKEGLESFNDIPSADFPPKKQTKNGINRTGMELGM